MKKISIIAFIAGLFFSGCSKKSSIEIDNNAELILKSSSQKEYKLAVVLKNIETLHVEYITVDIKELQSNLNELLIYEKVLIDNDRIFNYSTKHNISYIFNAKDIYVVYQHIDIMMLQLKLQDRTYLNVLVESSNDTVLNVVYGFSNGVFLKLIKEIDKDVNEGNEPLHFDVHAFTTNIKPRSDWSDKKLLLEPLTMTVAE